MFCVLEEQMPTRAAVLHRKRNMKTTYQSGFIAFTSLLVVSAVTLAIALSIPSLGLTEVNTSLSYKKSQEALKIAESCIEEALLRLRDTATYSGGTLTVGDGSCTATVSGSGSNRTIISTGTITGPPQYIKKIQVTIQRTGNSINLLTWQEIE